MHPSLVNFYFIAQNNYNAYIFDNNSELQLVFVIFSDEVEFNDIQNWTITNIDDEIKQLISNIKDDDEKKGVQMTFKKLKGKQNGFRVTFLNELRKMGKGGEEREVNENLNT